MLSWSYLHLVKIYFLSQKYGRLGLQQGIIKVIQKIETAYFVTVI